MTKICLRRSKPLVTGAIYRPPSEGDVNQEVHISGDFNCNMLKKTGLSSSIHDICNLIGATQLITEPTRVT